MPGLRKLISRFSLRKDNQARTAIHEGQPALRTANLKLQKKRATSNLRNGPELDHSGLSIRPALPDLRRVSSISDNSMNDVEGELGGATVQQHKCKHCSGGDQRAAEDDSPSSSSGSSTIRASTPLLPTSAQSTYTTIPREPVPTTKSESAPMFGRYGLGVHSCNLASATSLQRSVGSRLPLVPAPSEVTHAEQVLPSGYVGRAGSEESRKNNVIDSSEGNWAIKTVRRNEGPGHDDGNAASPTDSGVAFSEPNAVETRRRKGKGRLFDHASSTRPLSNRKRRVAVEEWLEHEAGLRGAASSRSRIGRENIDPFHRDEFEHWNELEEIRNKGREDGNYLGTERETSGFYQSKEEAESRKLQEAEDRISAELLQQQFRREQQVEEEKLTAKYVRTRDCVVCGEPKDLLDFPATSPTAACRHNSETCIECLQSWMASEFETKGCEGIKCPECSQTLGHSDVQRAASAETFEAYDRLAMRNALGSLDDFAWCLKAGCGSGQLNIGNDNYMDCASCGYKQCLMHKVPWHVGETCSQYDYRLSGQKAREEEEAILDKLSKKCPGQNCGWRIEKVAGCDHMRCKKCRFEFCWQCLASHAEVKRIGNTAHASTCKFHSENLNVAWPFNVH
ncbi:hypothetical protein LTR37_017993 [Vermiconidia calcicola]|uniref:Uncharacterized protein n=1 Tax=Vermiconidia calcicola TaxID=1690605 RepID=A0ACC3MK15_9PEZI|nr:hypothetical protein LTR37_017993 [Vermiconidia calcicola]